MTLESSNFSSCCMTLHNVRKPALSEPLKSLILKLKGWNYKADNSAITLIKAGGHERRTVPGVRGTDASLIENPTNKHGCRVVKKMVEWPILKG
ncbi:hypothetical protein CEXT_725441 [Caerostris extrusa]|uniref:Uncharacterized protein n=1 Tax=Caerostris extrusa TaxID=172846 RepID=A0AAV4YBK4_CAEEX|nr:hypothetical protein CEXT_725441 [Caerostris extrusa]